jgi:hypothetical protein
VIQVSGKLKNREHQSCGISYGYRYLFGDNTVEKQVNLDFSKIGDSIRIIEPVITWEGSTVELADDRTVIIRKGEIRVQFRLISGNATLSCGMNREQYRSVYPALTACPIVMTIAPDGNGEKENIVYRFEIGKW